MATIYEQMLAAGLPVIDAEEGQTPHFSRLLTLEEEDIRDEIMNPSTLRNRTLSKNSEARHSKAILEIQPLVGRNISSINNNADRDTLLRTMAYLLGVCDENGIILP